MDILENPFFILSASTRDNRQQLMNLSEERSLISDDELGTEAASLLTNPKKRLIAEMSWLPGMAPKRVEECIELLKSNPQTLLYRLNILGERDKKIELSVELRNWLRERKKALEKKRSADAKGEAFEIHRRVYDPKMLDGSLQKELSSYIEKKNAQENKLEIPAISRTNLAAAILGKIIANFNCDEISKLITRFAESYEDVDLDSVLMLVNEERKISGFPPVSDMQSVETELFGRRQYYLEAIRNALDQLPSKDLVGVITEVVETVTEGGDLHAPILIDDLVDTFEVHTQEFFEIETSNIKVLIDQIKNQAVNNSTEEDILDDVVVLEKVVKNWDIVAQPIQVSARSRGLSHDLSHEVARKLRSLAIELFNDFHFTYIPKRLTDLNQEVFAEVDEVVERSIEDMEALDKIVEQREQIMGEAANRDEEWRQAITYEADVGVIFRNRLSISPDGIIWKGSKWDLDSITRIRWGATQHFVNGNLSETTYKIFLGNNLKSATIELKELETYNNFIECLWRSVGIRLLTQFLQGLRAGSSYPLGDGMISDQGVEFERKRIFSENQNIFCRWSELGIWNGNGTFIIGKENDKKLFVAASYQDDDNVHITEAAIRLFWRRGGDRISSLLEG